MLAVLAHSETLRLPPDQARDLANALHDVGKHYPLPVVSPDKLALGVLVYTAGRVYVPMVVAFVTEQRAPAAPPGQSNSAPAQAMPVPAAPPRPAASPWFEAAPNSVN